MKKYLLIVVLFYSSQVFCQTVPVRINITDSVEIIYESSKKLTEGNQTFYYVDGKLSSPSEFGAIDRDNIKDVKVRRNANGSGEVHIILYDPSKVAELVLLSQEIEKYLGRLDTPTIYILNQVVLKDDLNTYKIKKNNILRIEVMTSDDIASLSQFKLRVIKVSTRLPKNLDKAKIYIR